MAFPVPVEPPQLTTEIVQEYLELLKTGKTTGQFRRAQQDIDPVLFPLITCTPTAFITGAVLELETRIAEHDISVDNDLEIVAVTSVKANAVFPTLKRVAIVETIAEGDLPAITAQASDVLLALECTMSGDQRKNLIRQMNAMSASAEMGEITRERAEIIAYNIPKGGVGGFLLRALGLGANS